MGIKWNLIVVFICMYLMTNDAENLFTCLLAICSPSLKKCLLRSFVHFQTELSAFSLLSCKSSLYIMDTRPLSAI